MSFFGTYFNHQFETIGAAKVPRGVGDRYYAQDLARDHRYTQGLAGRLFLQSLGVNSALISGGLVTEGSSKTELNVTAAVGIADFDVDVTKDSDGWAVPAPTETAQIPMRIEVSAQTDFDISGATLDGVTVNYLKARYAEANVQTRVKQFASGSYNYAVRGSFVLAADSSAPTDKDVVLCSFIGNGTSTLTITQRYPVGPAGQQMAQASALGVTYDGDDPFMGEKLSIAISHGIGDLVSNELGNAPVTLSASRGATNPTAARYNPVIPRGDGDHDISTTQTTQAVIDKFKNAPLTVGGYSSYAVTVSGSTITVTGPSNTVRDALLQSLLNCGYVNRWKSSGESATYAASGPDWTYASRIYCVTIDGVDYPITAVSVGSATITVTGTPASGSQTLYVYPMRIAGSTTSARLRSLAGFVPVPSGDGSMTIIAMAQLMDTIQGHNHQGSYGNTSPGSTNNVQMSANFNGTQTLVGDPITDGTNGAPRTGKTTAPRTIGVNLYTWLGVLLATSWTTA
jgi:hypothetical protein